MRRVLSCSMVVAALSSSALAGCSGDKGPTEQLSGAVGRVVSPNGAEGAAVIELAGVVDSVVVAGGQAFLKSANGVTRAALVLERPGLIRFSLPRLVKGSGPAATVVQVADGNNQLRPNAGAYRVDYER